MADEEVGYKKPPKSKRFKKGDPRINRKGRPKSFDTLRSLAQEVAHEVAKKKDGSEVVIDNHKVTVIEAILRQWAADHKRQKDFVEYAFGRVPAPVEIGADKEIRELLALLQQVSPADRQVIEELIPDVANINRGIEA